MLRAPCSQLNASHNQITYLDPLAKLKSLRVVVLNDNQIRVTVPLRGLKELSALVLSRNKIDGLDVREFGKLKKLSVSHNQLRTCPKVAGCCKGPPACMTHPSPACSRCWVLGWLHWGISV